MKAILSRAMHAADDYVVSLDYEDAHGIVTRRIVSPIRFMPGERFLGLCLCREEPRQFALARCSNIRLCRAADFLMPVPVVTLSMPAATCGLGV